MNDKNMAVLTNIIGAVEAGDQNYGKRDYTAYAAPYANSNTEHTITLGWAQYYGYEAKKLIQMIYDHDSAAFRKIDSNGEIKAMKAPQNIPQITVTLRMLYAFFFASSSSPEPRM